MAVVAQDRLGGPDADLPLSPFFDLVHHPRLTQLDQVRLAASPATAVLVDLASRADLAPGAVAALVGRRLPEVDRELMRSADLTRGEQRTLLGRHPHFAQHLAMSPFLDCDLASELLGSDDPDVLAALAMNAVVPLSPAFLYRDCGWSLLRVREVEAFLRARDVDEEAVDALAPTWDGTVSELADVCATFAPDGTSSSARATALGRTSPDLA